VALALPSPRLYHLLISRLIKNSPQIAWLTGSVAVVVQGLVRNGSGGARVEGHGVLPHHIPEG